MLSNLVLDDFVYKLLVVTFPAESEINVRSDRSVFQIAAVSGTRRACNNKFQPNIKDCYPSWSMIPAGKP